MSNLVLPRLLSDGAVFQKDKPINIWGFDDAGLKVECKLYNADDSLAASAECITDDNGRFNMTLPAFEAGRVFVLKITDETGNEAAVNDIITGAVWFASGQSNMDLTFDRLRDNYPEVISSSENSNIRCFDIVSETEYSGPQEDTRTGSWKKACPENMYGFSGTSYFFAKRLHEMTGLPVGMVHASLGGSHIYSWMSKEMLKDYPELLEEASRYADPEYRAMRIKRNEELSTEWFSVCDDGDKGRIDGWQNGLPEYVKDTLEMPRFFEGTALDGFSGVVWFEKKFNASKEFAGKEAKIWLGTITDSDEVYVNGTLVGSIGYLYPPRKYTIPEGVIVEGKNTVVIRITVNHGTGRITPGKRMMIFNDSCKPDAWSNVLPEGAIDLSGEWKYSIGAKNDLPYPDIDFIDWKATGLYNCMTAPCTKYPIEGIIWYQGESDSHFDDYLKMSKIQIEGYRKLWGDDDIPFIFAQLPNFTIDCGDPDCESYDSWWEFREVQRRITEEVPGSYMAVLIDAGEDNDLHPMNKELVGRRLADIALDVKYPGKLFIPSTGPEVKETIVNKTFVGYEVILKFKGIGNGLIAYSPDKAKSGRIKDFTAQAGGKIYPAIAELIDNNTILLRIATPEFPEKIMYLQSNTYTGDIIYNTCIENKKKVPCKLLGPFVMEV